LAAAATVEMFGFFIVVGFFVGVIDNPRAVLA